jgi:hypothetical protein
VSYEYHTTFGELGSTDGNDLFLIWCHEHERGGSVLWWRAQGKGYTSDIDEAGIYSRAEAEGQSRSRKSDEAVPVPAARRAIVRRCDGLRLRQAMQEAAFAANNDFGVHAP